MIIHEEPAEYSYLLRLVLIIPAGLFIGAIVLAANRDYEGFFTLIGEAALIVAIFYFILPRRYQIYQDKLRVVLGASLGINIPLATIREVKRSSGAKAYVYSGIRLTTSSRYVLEIVRNKGANYVISPKNGDIFLEQLNPAIKSQLTYR